jgi:hypothetical protein
MAVAARGRPRRHVSERKLMRPAVTGSPIYYRSSRGGSWRFHEYDLLYALDMYSEGEPILVICETLGCSRYQLYKNISPYLERR